MKNEFHHFVRIFLAVFLFVSIVSAGSNVNSVGRSPNRASGVVVDTPKISIPIVINLNYLWSYGLMFGVHPDATTGIDTSLGEREYPPLAIGGGDAKFRTPGGNTILDLHPYTGAGQTDTYVIRIPFENSDTDLFPIIFSWPKLNSYYSGSVRFKSDSTGSIFDIDMKTRTSYVLTQNDYPLPPGMSILSVYIVAEGPLPGNSLPVVTTFGVGNGGFQGIVNAITPPVNLGKTSAATTVWFEYGPTFAYGASTATQIVSDGSMTNVSSPFDVSTLPPNSRYHVRAVAQTASGTFYGGDRLISNGSPTVGGYADTGKFRTGTYFDWSHATDAWGKRKAVKAKNDKVSYTFNLVVPATNPAPTSLLIKLNTVGYYSLAVWSGKGNTTPITWGPCFQFIGNSKIKVSLADCPPSPLLPGDVIEFDGVSDGKKQLKVDYQWLNATDKILSKGSIPSGPLTPGDTIKAFAFILRMPNLHNVGEGIYGGVMQTPVVITVGTNNDIHGAHTVYLPKYQDVLKSLVKQQKGGDLYHVNAPRCLNTFDKNLNAILTAQKGLPPDKHNNILFAEQLVLKMNIMASDSDIFPQGFGDLIYDNSAFTPTAFDGKTVRQIVALADSFLGCEESPEIDADSSVYQSVLHMINGAFSAPDPIDTASWNGKKVICTGYKTVAEVPFLYPNPTAAPIIAASPNLKGLLFNLPRSFELSQNYPNPFNPTTTIKFNLPASALVTLKVYNVLGQEVMRLLDGEMMDDGEQEVQFNASDFASGVYFYRLEAQTVIDQEKGLLGEKLTAIKKMMLVK